LHKRKHLRWDGKKKGVALKFEFGVIDVEVVDGVIDVNVLTLLVCEKIGKLGICVLSVVPLI